MNKDKVQGESAGNSADKRKFSVGRISGFAIYAVCYILLAVWGFVRDCPLYISILSISLLCIGCLDIFAPRFLFTIRRMFMLKFKDVAKSVPDRFEHVGKISGNVLLTLSMLLILIYACSAPK